MVQEFVHRNELKNDPKIQTDDKNNIDEKVASIEKEIKALKNNPTPTEMDWKKDLNQRIQDSQDKLKEIGLPYSQKERVKLEVDHYKYLLEHNIKYDETRKNAYNF